MVLILITFDLPLLIFSPIFFILLPVQWSCFASVHGYVKEGPDHRRSVSPPAVTKGPLNSILCFFSGGPQQIQSITKRNMKGDRSQIVCRELQWRCRCLPLGLLQDPRPVQLP